MDENEFEKYFKERYESEIEYYENKAISSKKWYGSLQLSLIIFSAMTPILIVIDIIFQEFPGLRWIAVAASICIAILATSLKTFKFHENWVNYRTTAELLKKEQYFYKANTSEYATTQDKKAIFVKRVENLISQAHVFWVDEYKIQAQPE